MEEDVLQSAEEQEMELINFRMCEVFFGEEEDLRSRKRRTLGISPSILILSRNVLSSTMYFESSLASHLTSFRRFFQPLIYKVMASPPSRPHSDRDSNT